MKKLTIILAALALAVGTTACASDADTARHNLDRAAEQFEVERRIVFINGITDNYMLEIVGKCSYEAEANQSVVICKTGPGKSDAVKHALTRSDNSFVVVEQLKPVPVDFYRHRIIFKPEGLLPDVDFETSMDIEGDG